MLLRLVTPPLFVPTAQWPYHRRFLLLASSASHRQHDADPAGVMTYLSAAFFAGKNRARSVSVRKRAVSLYTLHSVSRSFCHGVHSWWPLHFRFVTVMVSGCILTDLIRKVSSFEHNASSLRRKNTPLPSIGSTVIATSTLHDFSENGSALNGTWQEPWNARSCCCFTNPQARVSQGQTVSSRITDSSFSSIRFLYFPHLMIRPSDTSERYHEESPI